MGELGDQSDEEVNKETEQLTDHFNEDWGWWENVMAVTEIKRIPFDDVFQLKTIDFLNTLSFHKARTDRMIKQHEEQMKKIKSGR